MNPPSPVNTELELARALLGREPMNPRAWLGLGKVLEQQYRHAEALKVYREGMARLPCEAGLKQAVGILLMHGGKLWQALPLLESALAASSEPAPELLEALAGVLLELGQVERAHHLLSAGDGERTMTRVLLALAEQQLGRPEQAIGHYQRALELTEPGSSQAARICHNLGNLYCLAGELPAAEAAFAQALEHSPGLARTQLQLDLLQLQTRSQEEILARYQSFVQRHPGHPALTRMLCRMARLQAGLLQPALALEYLNRALALDPEYVPAHLQRGKLLLEAQQSAQARSCFETVFALKDLPSGPALQTTDSEQLEALAGLAEVLIQEQRPAAATQLLEAFLETGDSSIASCYAEACGLLGSPEAALAPLEAVLAQPPLPLAERRILLYRLGGLHDLCRRPEQAFACFSAAKQAAPNDFDTGSAFDAGQCIRLTDALIHSFDAGLLAAALRGSSSRRPVFIVGMPRSGTSLTEAILCAHPDVFGAGELNLIQQLFRRLLGPDLPEEDGQTWRGRLQTLTAAEWATAASDYLQHLEALSDGPGYLRISDKMPANFRYLGLIQLLFPDAAVIHCQRHPLDVCLSCYSQPFSFLAYTRSLDDLGLYYQQYQRLMAHWRTVLRLPLLELRYEDLVQQPEATVRRLLDHCGLDWNPRCLDFHTNTRPVRTASSRQVRKPLYTSSVGRYKLYEPSLEPLKKYLDLTGW